MKLGIFTTITRPYERGDNVDESLACYNDLADVVTVIDGEKTWPQEFHWQLIADHFQRGYEQCDADWVLHMDMDFYFHENNFDDVRQGLSEAEGEPALGFLKWQFILPDRYNIKSRLILAVNKKEFGDRIKFDGGGESDLCQPSLDGKYLSPDDVKILRIPFYNYEKLTKTKEQIADDVGRMDRAYFACFGKYQYGNGDDQSAYEGWYHMVQGRFAKPSARIPLEAHPKYVQEIIKNLTPDQFGYNGFGLIEGRVYA